MVVVSYVTAKPTEAQIATCINLKDYWPEKYNGIKDFRVIGLLIIVTLIVFWAILEMVA